MADDKLFAGSIPEIYDRFLVPLIFEPYARDMAARVALLAPQSVLETAAGTGVVSEALCTTLPASTKIITTDLNPPMLEAAARRPAVATRAALQPADALALPFPDASFDCVVCQFGAMFFPDKVAGYREARRVLRAGGTFLFSIWDGIEENVFAHVVTQAVGGMFPNDPPLFLARTPHGHADEAAIRAHLAEAGFSRVSISRVTETSRASRPIDAAFAYCEGTPLRNEILARDAGALQSATDAATKALQARFGAGPIDGKISALIITAAK